MDAPTATNPNVSETLTQSLKQIVVDFRAALYRHGHLHPAAMPLVSLLLQYLTRAIARFAAASQRTPTPPRPKPTSDPIPTEPRSRKPSPFPRKFAWLLALLPPTPTSGALAGGARRSLITLLDTPELIALLHSNPSIGRILRPLCHIFGIHQPQHLRLPNHPAPHPKKPTKPPHPPYPPIPITIPPGTNYLALFFPKKSRS